MTECAVLEVKPSSVGDVSDRSGVYAVTNAAFGREPSEKISFTFPVSGVISDGLVSELAEMLSQIVGSFERIIIDASFDATIPRAWVTADILVANAVLACRSEFRESTQIVILTETLPANEDEIAGLRHAADVSPHITFAGLAIPVDESAPDPGLVAATESSRAEIDSLLISVRLRTLRERGVHSARSMGGRPFYKYRYTTASQGHDALIQLIESYLAHHQPEFVVFDEGSAGDWFRSCLLSACDSCGVGVLDINSVAASEAGWSEGERTSVANAKAAIIGGRSIILAVPTFKTGVAIMDSFSRLGGRDVSNVRVMSIFLDCRDHDAPRSQCSCGIWSLGQGDVSGSPSVDYLIDAPIDTMASHDWEPICASVLNEVVSSGVSRRDIYSRTGLLSLYHHYGADVERLPAGGRAAVRWFPRLFELDEWDAHWLAECLLRRIESMLNYPARSRIVVVMPDEATGARPIYDAVRLRMGISPIVIPRSVIDGQVELSAATRRDLRSWSLGARVLVLDESSVTYGTLRALGDIVQNVLHRCPDIFASIVDCSDNGSRPPQPYVSLDSWRPLLFQELGA